VLGSRPRELLGTASENLDVSYFIVGQSSPAWTADCRLRSPGLELQSSVTPTHSFRCFVYCRNAKQLHRLVGTVRVIDECVGIALRRLGLGSARSERRLSFFDHLQHCANRHFAALESRLIGLQLQHFVDSQLAVDAILGDGEHLVEDHIEGGYVRPALLRASCRVAALPLLETATHWPGSKTGVPPVICTQRSTATST
jgi:hypothetical protein